MTLLLRKVLPWLLFVLVVTAALAIGNRAVQKATMRDYNAEYSEYHLSYLEKEVVRLRAQNLKLQQEIEDNRIGD